MGDRDQPSIGLDLLSVPVVVVILLAAAAAIGSAAGTVSGHWALVGAGALATLGLLAVAFEVRGDEVADQRRASRYERNGAPLALIDGTDLDATFVGWELERVGSGSSPGRVVVGYEVVDPEPDGYRWLELYFETDRDGIDCAAGSCEELGRRSDGRPILGFRPSDSTVGSSGFSDLWVEVEGGRWRISSTVSAVEPRSAVAVLEALEAVDADAFAAGT